MVHVLKWDKCHHLSLRSPELTLDNFAKSDTYFLKRRAYSSALSEFRSIF